MPRMQITPPNGGVIGKLANNYVTQCKVCRFAVYHTQKHEWSNRPLGISHSECLK